MNIGDIQNIREIIIEGIGYVGSAFVAISLLMTAMHKLRVLSLVGAFLFILYAILLPSIPVLITNVFIGIINLTQLIRLWKGAQKKESQSQREKIQSADSG